MKKVLVIAAHPDDEILGIGGTVKRHSLDGDTCYGLILGEGLTSRKDSQEDTNREDVNNLHANAVESGKIIGYKEIFFANLPDNRFDSIDLLEVVKIIEMYIEKLQPEVVYTHHGDDLNIDHRVTFNAVLTATRPIGDITVKEVYTFETPSSTEWNFSNTSPFVPNVFVDVESTIEYKLKAMTKYESEIRDYPHPRSLESLSIIAKRWGTVVGLNYVEAFKLIRKVI